MTDYTELYPDIQVYAPTAPLPNVQKAVQKAARMLCRDAEIYRKTETVSLTAGTSLYALSPPAGTRISEILLVQYDGNPIEESTDRLLDSTMPKWRTETGDPQHYLKPRGDNIQLAPVPKRDQTDILSVTYSVQPDRTAISLDDDIVEEFWDALVAGAVATLLLEVGQPWYNPEMGSAKQVEYTQRKDEAQRRARKTNRPVTRTTTYGGIH